MLGQEARAERSGDRAPRAWAALAAVFIAASGTQAFAQQPAAADASAESTFVVLEADELVNDDEAQTITAVGNVEVRYQGRLLRADQLVYDIQKSSIRAKGNVEIVEPDGAVRYATEVEVDENLDTGVAAGFGARIAGGGTAAAAAAVRREPGRNELTRVIYTACPICKAEEGKEGKAPTWTLRARRAIQDSESRMLTYRDVVLRIGPVPVIYLPYFTHPDPSSGARTGLLPPDLGANSRFGAFYEQPFYWAISPSQDMTLAPRLHEKVNPLLGVEYRKRFYSGAMQLDTSLGQDQDFDGDGRKFGEDSFRGHIFGDGRFAINDTLSWGFGIERASDDLFLRRYDIDGVGQNRGPFVGDQFRLISQLFGELQTDNTYGNVAFVGFQGLRQFDGPQNLPLILPVGEVEHVRRDPLFDGQLRLQASTAQLYRSEGIDSARASAGVEWRRDTLLPGGMIVAPFAMARGDLYRIGNNTPAAKDESFGRAVGLAGAEVRWPFLRPGKTMDIIVEPIAMAGVGTKGGNDVRIANEDSLAFELDESSIFRPAGAPNYDVWEPGTRGSAGVRATVRARNGYSGSVMFGQRWRDQDEPRFAPSTNLADNKSDYVAAVRADLGGHFGIDARVRLDNEEFEATRIDAGVRGSLWRLSANARYYSVEQSLRPGDPSKELRSAASLRLTDRWSVSYGMQRDLNLDRTLTQSAQLTYRDDCTFFEVTYQRNETFDRVLGPDEGFRIRVGLNSLGVLGGN